MMNEIKTARHAQPFEPFLLQLSGRQSICVTHPDAISYGDRLPVSIAVYDPYVPVHKKVALRQITSIGFPPEGLDQASASEAA
ncbi:MAG: hypothetical protein AAGI30_09670 [Planctomycetota bacterium]